MRSSGVARSNAGSNAGTARRIATGLSPRILMVVSLDTEGYDPTGFP
jgi:hypothetical protein